MLGTRYEEYSDFKNKPPFVLHCDLTRTSSTCGHEANWHDNLEIQICRSGSGYVILDGERVEFKENDIVVVNSHVIHYTSTDSKMSYSCIIVDSDYCKKCGIDYLGVSFNPIIKSQKILGIFSEIEQVYDNEEDICRIAKCCMLTLELLIELRTKHSSEKEEEIKNNRHFKTVRAAIAYIQENYAQKLVLEEIAKKVYTDKFVLSREFKKATRQTLFEYINSFRCKMADSFIQKGFSISDSARMSGFNNMSFFTKTFKRYMGRTPSQSKK